MYIKLNFAIIIVLRLSNYSKFELKIDFNLHSGTPIVYACRYNHPLDEIFAITFEE